MGACGSAPVAHDQRLPSQPARSSHSLQPPPASPSQDDDDDASSDDASDGASDTDDDDPPSCISSSSPHLPTPLDPSHPSPHPPTTTTCPLPRKKRRKHRRNKSRHLHKKAQRSVVERIRQHPLLFEPSTADVIHSPVVSAREGDMGGGGGEAVGGGIGGGGGGGRGEPLASPASGQLLTVPGGVGGGVRGGGGMSLREGGGGGGMQAFDPEEVTVLLIDSDREVTAAVESWLSACRYSVIACEEGKEGVEVLLEAGATDRTSPNPLLSSLPTPFSPASSSSSSSSSSPSPAPHPSDRCDIDLIIVDWNVSIGSTKFLDWTLDNQSSLSHIPVIVLCDDEMTAQGMDRLVKRGAADILRKPLVHQPFLHSVRTILHNRVEAAHAELLKSRGDQYKAELAKGGKASLLLPGSALSTPKRSLSSMLSTFVQASPRAAAGGGEGGVDEGAISQVHAVLVSADESLHAAVAAAVAQLPLHLHSCSGPRESLVLQEGIDVQSNSSSIISNTSSTAELLSPHFPSHFAFSLSNAASPTSSSTASLPPFSALSTRPSILQDSPLTPLHSHHPPIIKKHSSGTETSTLLRPPSAGPSSSIPLSPSTSHHHPSLHPPPPFPHPSPRWSAFQARGSLMQGMHGVVSSYFGVELFVLDAAVMRGEEGMEWMEVMKGRSVKQQTPVLLLTPEDDPCTQLIRDLHPLSLTTIGLPLSGSLLKQRLQRVLESVDILRHQRLYAYRAQAYRMLVKKMREKRDRDKAGGGGGGGGGGQLQSSKQGVLVLGEGATALNPRSSLSMSHGIQHHLSDDDGLRSLLSSPTGQLPRLSLNSPAVRHSSRAFMDAMQPPSRKASEVLLQPFVSFPPPGLYDRKGSEESESGESGGRGSRSHVSGEEVGGEGVWGGVGGGGGRGVEVVAGSGRGEGRGQLLTTVTLVDGEEVSLRTTGVAEEVEHSSPSTRLERSLNTLVDLARLDPTGSSPRTSLTAVG